MIEYTLFKLVCFISNYLIYSPRIFSIYKNQVFKTLSSKIFGNDYILILSKVMIFPFSQFHSKYFDPFLNVIFPLP